jgi:hypothetical protein
MQIASPTLACGRLIEEAFDFEFSFLPTINLGANIVDSYSASNNSRGARLSSSGSLHKNFRKKILSIPLQKILACYNSPFYS